MKVPRILLVDDEEEVLRLLSRRLTRLGYRVATAADGSQALARLHEAEFDVVVLDFTMPGMTGLDLAERCRAEYPAVKILMLTGSPVIEEIEAARYPCLQKPLENLQEVEQAIERLLASREGGGKAGDEGPSHPCRG